MVYDVPRNFIGDTHWREPQGIQDGDELELEKGVLIQVGEATGKTETDLSELLDKNKAKPIPAGEETHLKDGGKNRVAKQHQPLETPQHPVERPTSSSFAHLRPKSLNALLGKSGGAIGRAAVPTKSPAELRRQEENYHTEEGRSPKRRRIQYPESTSPSVASTGIRRTSLESLPAKKVKNSTSINVLTLANSRQISEERKIEQGTVTSRAERPAIGSPKEERTHRSRGEQRKRDPQPNEYQDPDTSPTAQANPKRNGQEAKSARQREAKAAPQEPKARSKPERRKSAGSDERLGNPVQPGIEPIEDQTSKERPLEDEPRPEHLLRIASKKPRKKLMYRDLLPQKAPPSHEMQPVDHLAAPQKTSSKHMAADTLNDFHDDQRNRLQDRLDRRTKSAENPSEQTHLDWDENLEDGSISLTKAFDYPNIDPTPSDSLFLTPPSPNASRPNNPLIPSTEPERLNPPLVDPVLSSTQAARTLTKLDSLLLQHPFQPQPQLQLLKTKAPNQKPETIKAALPPPGQQPVPLQRSVSDLTTSNHPPENAPAKRTTRNNRLNTYLLPHKALAVPSPAPIPTVPAPTANLNRAPKIQRSDSTISVSQEAAPDPWSREAWDLFGFEGGDKSVGTGNGVKGEWDGRVDGRGNEEDEGAGMMESQGWV